MKRRVGNVLVLRFMKISLFGLVVSIISFTLTDDELTQLNENSEGNRRICWIQNAGFFIDLPNGDILIDAILSSNDAVANAEAPYDDVRLIFVSHVHGDHFNAGGIIKHLKANPKAQVVLTPESFESLKRQGLDRALESRVLVSFPEIDEMEAFHINGFSGHILQFKHAGVQNIGLGLHGDEIDLVYLNGGIQDKDLVDEFSKNYVKNNLLIANKWPLNNSEYVSKVEELFNPGLLLMAHHSGVGDEIVSRNGGVSEMESKMSFNGMKGVVFEKRMQCQQF